MNKNILMVIVMVLVGLFYTNVFAAQAYVVKKGDCLREIAKSLNVKTMDLYDANKEIIGSNPDLIFPGQMFAMPLNNEKDLSASADKVDRMSTANAPRNFVEAKKIANIENVFAEEKPTPSLIPGKNQEAITLLTSLLDQREQSIRGEKYPTGRSYGAYGKYKLSNLNVVIISLLLVSCTTLIVFFRLNFVGKIKKRY